MDNSEGITKQEVRTISLQLGEPRVFKCGQKVLRTMSQCNYCSQGSGCHTHLELSTALNSNSYLAHEKSFVQGLEGRLWLGLRLTKPGEAPCWHLTAHP